MEQNRLDGHFGYGRLLKFSAPSISMMIFTSIYSLIDGIFISNFVGKEEFASINLVWPILMIIGAIGIMFGTGGSALVAKTMGEGDTPRANRYFSMVTEACTITGIILSIIVAIFLEPLMRLLGATAQMMPFCLLYGRVLLGVIVFDMLQTLFQSFFVTAGRPKIGFLIMLFCGIVNLVLDALFIIVFDWGLAGAAAATAAGYVSGTILAFFFFRRTTHSPLKLHLTKIELAPVVKSATNGLSEFMSNTCIALVNTLYNYQLLKLTGSEGVVAYGMLMYVAMLFSAIFFGFAMGSSPVIAFHFGAKNNAEVRGLLKKGLVLNTAGGVAMLLFSLVIARPLSALYVGYDEHLLEFCIRAFKLYNICYILFGVNIFMSAFFTALNNGFISAAIALSRSVFEAIAVFAVPAAIGIGGIWFSSTISEISAGLCGAYLLYHFRFRYGYAKKNQG